MVFRKKRGRWEGEDHAEPYFLVKGEGKRPLAVPGQTAQGRLATWESIAVNTTLMTLISFYGLA